MVGEFFIASGDAAVAFNPGQEVFDGIVLPVESAAEPAGPAAIFIRSMFQETEVSGGRGAHTFYMLRGKQIEEFVDLENVTEKAALVSGD